MNKFEMRTNKKKENIILASLKLFGTNGFKNTNIKMIASEAQVSQVSIYNYYENKEALILACVDYLMQDTLEKCDAILLENISFENKIEKALELCNNDFNLTINQYFSKEALTEEKLRDLLIVNSNKYKNDIYTKFILLGKEENKINKKISTDTILKFFEAINLIGINADDQSLERLSKELKILLFHGILEK